MSREIEFRVWNTQKNQWVDFSRSDIGLARGKERCTICFFSFRDKYLVEQYIGLKDKNGKEIFEGDIIQRDDEDGTVGVVEFDKNEAKFVINDSGVRDGFDFFDRDEWEIIGNIHEPPKDFRPEHLKRMGVSISKGGEE